jgi:hypothetical protein
MTFNVKQYYCVFWPCRPFDDLNFNKVIGMVYIEGFHSHIFIIFHSHISEV